MKNFRKLTFWERSKQLAIDIYTTTGKFPISEQFGLTNQMRRSAVSIPSNIAEGASRVSDKEFARFLEIALGSAHELETQLEIACSVCFLSKEEHKVLADELLNITRLIGRYRSSIKRLEI